MRIFILGGSGSGKTTLAGELTRITGIPNIELDDLRFEKKFSVQRPPEESKRLLRKTVMRKDWIVEGVSTSWTQDAAMRADMIVWMHARRRVRVWRITKRFFARREGLKEFLGLLRWTWTSENPGGEYYRMVQELLKLSGGELVEIRTKTDYKKFLERMKK